MAATISENLQADFSIESLDLIFFNRVVMKEVMLKDQPGDTLLHAPGMVATLKKYDRKEKKILLSRLKLEQATIRISLDTAKVNNLQFIVNALRKPPDSTQTEKWRVNFESIEMKGSRFLLDNDFRPREVPSGINFTDLHIGEMDLDITEFNIENDTVRFRIDHLAFLEKAGFRMDHLEAVVYINKEFFFWRNVHFYTSQSDVRADRIDFRFRQWKDFGRDETGNVGVISKVRLDYRFKPSTFYLPDVAHFAWIFRDIDNSAKMSGTLRGRINSFKGDDIDLEFGQNSQFSGSFDLEGLPDIQETYMFFDIDRLTTSIADIESFRLPGRTRDSIRISENLRQLGQISYRGKYAGFYNDFVTYGSLATDMGKISSDISIRPDADENVHFMGKIRTEGFDLGEIADLEDLAGKLNMEGNVEGVSHRGGYLDAKMDGHISLLELNGYPYQSIVLTGDLSNRRFDGSFAIADPNLKMEFFGKIDFTDTLPVFDFTADVDKAMLYPMNIATSDPSYQLSCYLRANFVGANPDDFDGEITLVNSLFQKQDKQIQIYDFNLLARHRPDTNQMTLRSDLVDAEITGKYEFEDIGRAAGLLLAYHIPSFRNIVKVPLEGNASLNNFRYAFRFKNTFPITDFFYPEVEIAQNSSLSGNYYPAIADFSMNGEFPELRYESRSFDDLKVVLMSDSTDANLKIASRSFKSGQRIRMDNLIFDAIAGKNAFRYDINWHNDNQERLYKGNIRGHAFFEYREKNIIPRTDLYFNDSEVVMGDTLWKVSHSVVSIDSSFIEFHDFTVGHARQSLEIDGIISEDQEDRLTLSFSNIDLSQINQAFGGLNLGGILNGTSTFSGIYGNPVFLSDLNIDGLSINDEELGNTFLQANWINPEQKVRIDLEAMRGNLKTLQVTGDYFPENHSLDLEMNLDKLKINIFQPYLSGILSELEGTSSGYLKLDGTLENPLLNGEVSVQKTSFLLDYLQTTYSVSDRLAIVNNDFRFNGIELFDPNGSRAILNGNIRMDHLNELRFNLNLEAENFRFLSTRETHNPQYYGTANATGRAGLTGTPGNMNLVIAARTERGTRMSIPINQGRDIQENNFITFINSDGAYLPEEAEEDYRVDLGGFNLDFQLEVTEDATAEIIFDPQVGDALQGIGNGNLQLSINPNDGFQMFGDYTIASGEYLFTLQNIINKRLKIQRGGTITWNGDPTGALINLNAVYNAKAAPGVLIPDPQEYLKNRMPVECHLIMEGNLLSPLISFDIVLPTAEEETKNVVRNAITTDEELTKQFLSLLVINNFASVASSTGGSSGTTGAGMAGVTAGELLSNQLSSLLSQISNDFDIGINYRPGDEITSDQVEVALSTQIFDDRVSIHTNVDVNTGSDAATAGQRTSTIAGDFDVEFKLSGDGKLRLKAYNRYNHDQLYKTSPYTQGVGFVYREDFNNFDELAERYSDAITGKTRRKKRKAREAQKNRELQIEEEVSGGVN